MRLDSIRARKMIAGRNDVYWNGRVYLDGVVPWAVACQIRTQALIDYGVPDASAVAE